MISLELQLEVEVVPVVCGRHRRVESVGACCLWETQASVESELVVSVWDRPRCECVCGTHRLRD